MDMPNFEASWAFAEERVHLMRLKEAERRARDRLVEAVAREELVNRQGVSYVSARG